jgi:hypothetical protein
VALRVINARRLIEAEFDIRRTIEPLLRTLSE